MCSDAYFYSVFFTAKHLHKKKPKNDNFSHFAKHRLIKKNRYVATPRLTKIGVFQLGLFETKNNDVEQQT